jgi:lipoyl(octanoyl) transferase
MSGRAGTTWRLIDTGPLSGAENMAIDEALLACFDPEESLPILRLYGWSPPAFSHGRFQQPEETVSLEKCAAAGVQVVRRITGGGLLYHGEELTYALVCPAAFVPGTLNVKSAFFHLTSFLIAFYRRLGLAPVHAADYYAGSRQLGGRSALCFAGTESCDILINGRKIGGNAQRRVKNIIFQHGSIPMQQLAAESQQYLLAAAPQIVTGTTALADEGIETDRNSLAAILTESFRDVFGVTVQADSLGAEEKEFMAGYMQKTE